VINPVSYPDGVGSIVALTDWSEATVEGYNYDTFGRVERYGNAVQNTYGFTGREYDIETGLYYYRARYYDPETGRFISKDPIGFAGGDANLYNYVLGDPINWTDPWGLFWEYSQSTGQLTYVDNKTGERTPIARGYSGYGAGLNNPAMQEVPFVGPIPQGVWDIGKAYNHAKLGSVTMKLYPRPDTDTFQRGRFTFRIHGNDKPASRNASKGCIVLSPRSIINRINNSGDRELRVVP